MILLRQGRAHELLAVPVAPPRVPEDGCGAGKGMVGGQSLGKSMFFTCK